MDLIIRVFWLFLPAGLANMAPVLFQWAPFLNKPIDFKKSLWGKRIFGDNKTWRGLIFGILTAIGTMQLQILIYPFLKDLSLIDYQQVNSLLMGLLLGGGALIGDLAKSFLKRRLNIEPGKSLIIADQIDWILGALIFSSLIYTWPWQIWLTAIILFGILHPITNLIGYWLKIRSVKL